MSTETRRECQPRLKECEGRGRRMSEEVKDALCIHCRASGGLYTTNEYDADTGEKLPVVKCVFCGTYRYIRPRPTGRGTLAAFARTS